MPKYTNCKFFCLDTVEEIDEYVGVTTAIPTTSMYSLPGYYEFNGKKYDMTREGLYRISGFNSSGTFFIYNKIIVNGWSGTSDIYNIMSAISWNHVHGTDDNSSNYQVVSNAGSHRKWRSQCGFISGMIHWLMPQIGHTSRVLNVITSGTQNLFDDGHIIVETQHNVGTTSSPVYEWRMWDITNRCYFRDSVGKHMSTSEFVSQIASNGTFPEKVIISNSDKTNSDSVYGVDLHCYQDMLFSTYAEQEDWYRRIFQTIL